MAAMAALAAMAAALAVLADSPEHLELIFADLELYLVAVVASAPVSQVLAVYLSIKGNGHPYARTDAHSCTAHSTFTDVGMALHNTFSSPTKQSAQELHSNLRPFN